MWEPAIQFADRTQFFHRTLAPCYYPVPIPIAQSGQKFFLSFCQHTLHHVYTKVVVAGLSILCDRVAKFACLPLEQSVKVELCGDGFLGNFVRIVALCRQVLYQIVTPEAVIVAVLKEDLFWDSGIFLSLLVEVLVLLEGFG